MSMQLPQDDFILLSLINTKLRDDYPTLADLCAGEDIDEEEVLSRLNSCGYVYDGQANAFVRS